GGGGVCAAPRGPRGVGAAFSHSPELAPPPPRPHATSFPPLHFTVCPPRPRRTRTEESERTETGRGRARASREPVGRRPREAGPRAVRQASLPEVRLYGERQVDAPERSVERHRQRP